MRGPAPRKLVLAVEHIEILQRNLRTGKTEHRVACRSRILLLRAEGYGPTRVAEMVGRDRTTVWRVEERYRSRGVGAVRDADRPGRPRTISPPAESSSRRARLQKAG
jgi:transposase